MLGSGSISAVDKPIEIRLDLSPESLFDWACAVSSLMRPCCLSRRDLRSSTVIAKGAYDAMLLKKVVVEGVIDCPSGPSVGIVNCDRARCFDSRCGK